MKNPIIFFLITVLILSSALYIRYPTIQYGMPYFYDEDEAHHFNRTMNMAKSGDLNPHYFHKPSLHFYLRLPVVYAAYFWSKHKGYLNDLSEVRTFNRFGIADYAFTASHPGIVKWNRAWSTLLSMGLIVFAMLIAKTATNSHLIALLSGVFCSVSPALVEYSATIGVDVLMSLMCLVSVYFSLLAVKKYSFKLILLSSIFAGLAVSSKYNAAPIGLVPLITLSICKSLNIKNTLKVFLIGMSSFLLASPYILISFNEFLSDLRYEIWHYGVAGHVGHMAEPGLEQASFYLNWFSEQAIGFAILALACIGVARLLYKETRISIVLISFPALYFLLMIAQKANFVRNMLVLIPFISIFAAVCIINSLSLIKRNKIAFFTTLLIVVSLCVYQPLTASLAIREDMINTKDSRDEATKWLFENRSEENQYAISGYLQLPLSLLRLKNFTTVNQEKTPLLNAYILGFDHAVFQGDFTDDQSSYIKIVKFISGELDMSRIVRNPAISIISFIAPPPIENLSLALESCTNCNLNFGKVSDDKYECIKSDKNGAGTEDYCWATSRYFRIKIPELPNLVAGNFISKISIDIMSPWQEQTLALLNTNGDEVSQKKLETAGAWSKFYFDLTENITNKDGLILFRISKVTSPLKESGSNDNRRLGLAIRGLHIQK